MAHFYMLTGYGQRILINVLARSKYSYLPIEINICLSNGPLCLVGLVELLFLEHVSCCYGQRVLGV